MTPNKDSVGSFDLEQTRDLLLAEALAKLPNRRHQLLWSEAVALTKAFERISKLEREIEAAYSVLACYGVPKERAGRVCNGIDVLMTRMRKQERFFQTEITELKHQLVERFK